MSLNLWEVAGWVGLLVISGLWLGCLIFSVIGRGRRAAITTAIMANLIIFTLFMLAGAAATELVAREGTTARVSLGAGIWLSAAGAYILVFAMRRRLDSSPVWKNLISWSGLTTLAILLASGWLHDLSVVQEFLGREQRFMRELVKHIMLFSGSVSLGALLGIPLGIWAVGSKRTERLIFFITNIMQTIPSLALFGLLMAPLSALSFAFPLLRGLGIRGVGAAPAIIALVIYSLLPIVRNTYVSIRQIDAAVINAGLGMGMSRSRIFRKLEVPLAAPLVMEGVRIAAVQAVGNTTVAALIGAGGLGWFVFQGLGQAVADLIILGAIPIIVLALGIDAIMRLLIRLVTPKGLAKEGA